MEAAQTQAPPGAAAATPLFGGLRAYLFFCITSRVDVELGARLFKHLLALPVNYFESHQAGQTVARMRELENIRDFITGSALTLIRLDRRLSTVMIRATNR